MGELFEQRVAMNEATFRKVNEAFDAGSDGPKGYLCECGQIGCNQLLSLSREEYEAVRADGKRFFVLPGHEILEAERIVEDHERYLVVEKTSAAGEIAVNTDPRDS